MRIVKSRTVQPHVVARCSHCQVDVEYIKPAESPFAIECASCGQPFTPTLSSSSSSSSSDRRKTTVGRRMGTDANPLEKEYYDILGVPTSASLQEIKSAYRRLAIKLHPDKNPNDPTTEEKFKKLAIAYNTLSDPVSRKKYNELGSQKDSDNVVIDPEAVFSTLFGGEQFANIIGTISLGSELKTALQEDPSEAPKPDSKLTQEERDAKAAQDEKAMKERTAIRTARVQKLSVILVRKLSLYTEQASSEHDEPLKQSVKQIWQIEASELSKESYGFELLQVVGTTYASKAAHHLASTGTPWGVGGWYHSAKSSAHLLSETYGALRAALDVKAAFDEIAKAEQAEGGLSQEQKKKMEEKAASKGMKALFMGSKLEVESVLREVCDQVLNDEKQSRQQRRMRAIALSILGEQYCTVERDPNAPDLLGLDLANSKAKHSSPTKKPLST